MHLENSVTHDPYRMSALFIDDQVQLVQRHGQRPPAKTVRSELLRQELRSMLQHHERLKMPSSS